MGRSIAPTHGEPIPPVANVDLFRSMIANCSVLAVTAAFSAFSACLTKSSKHHFSQLMFDGAKLICSLKKTSFIGHGRLPPFSKIDRHACFIVKDRSCAEKIKA